MCLYPKLIRNRKYTSTKKNGGVIPTVKDKRTLYVPVGCGKCMECKKQKARNWSVRLQEDIKTNKNAYFVTLTFTERSLIELGNTIEGLEGYEFDNEIAKKGVRRFLERWRKKYKKSVRHWLVTELGHKNTERIHLHGLIWTDIPEDIDIIWKYGMTYIGEYVNNKTINYIVKYINKIDLDHKEYIPKMLCSAGIGSNYLKTPNSKLNKYKHQQTKETYSTREGIKLALPIYYRNKIYSEEEREKLWIEKLDKNVRYVNGRKIDISVNEDDYYRVLEEERKINRKNGYGDNKINWSRRNYENQRRNLKKMERINKQQ